MRRALLGFGSGKSKIQLYVMLADASSEHQLYETASKKSKGKHPGAVIALNPYAGAASFVVKFGLKYLDDYGYEIVSDWTANSTVIDPKTIDWKGVTNGTVKDIMIRQKPGPKNFMGRMKFMFPNQFGVYLHDNPRRELFLKSARFFSGGCVRLEDAPRLGRWLFGRDLDWQSAGTEQPVPLAQPVPVYITYLTAMPDGTSIAYYDDVYGRDAPKLASSTATEQATAKP